MRKIHYFLLLLFVIINGIFNSKFQLHYDEAYYWVWSKNLALSYYDHPPLIAYLIYLTTLGGKLTSVFYVRLPALLAITISIVSLTQLARQMFDERVANNTFLLLIACPIFEVAAFIVTPDSPLILFWSLTILLLYQAIFADKVFFLYLAAITAGLMLLSKYTAVFIFPSFFLFLLCSKKYRGYLSKIHLYLAFILSWLIFLPVIIWNYRHHFISFIFQFKHGMSLDKAIHLNNFADFLGGQSMIVSPLLFIAIMYFLVKYWRHNIFANDKIAFLVWPFLVPILFFFYRGLFQHIEPNWTIIAYVTPIIMVGYYVAYLRNKWLIPSALVFMAFVMVIIKFPLVFLPQAIHNKIPSVSAFFNNQTALERLEPSLHKDTILLACDYANASYAWFYLQNTLQRVYVLDNFNFANNYRYWNYQLKTPIKDALYICNAVDASALLALKNDFKSVTLLKTITTGNKIADINLYVYKVHNN